jgi:hypothetical protein
LWIGSVMTSVWGDRHAMAPRAGDSTVAFIEDIAAGRKPSRKCDKDTL